MGDCMYEQKASGNSAQVLLSEIAKSLVREPAAVHVSSKEREDGVELMLHLSLPDADWIQKNGGSTIHALRTILQATGKREGIKFWLQVTGEPKVQHG